jgi:prevent-host-death family protein
VRIGLREANQRFSAVMRAVKAGQEVVLTERGKPVAVIRPLQESPGEEAGLRRLEATGMLRRAARRGPMPPWRARSIRGVPLSVTLREERDSS